MPLLAVVLLALGSDARTASVNSTIHEVATADGSIYVDTYAPLKGSAGRRDPTSELLADGDHLNARGHTVVAAAVVAGLERIRSFGLPRASG